MMTAKEPNTRTNSSVSKKVKLDKLNVTQLARLQDLEAAIYKHLTSGNFFVVGIVD